MNRLTERRSSLVPYGPRSCKLLGPRRRLRIELLESRRLLAVIGNNLSVGDELQNYRLAISTTAEYTAARGGAAEALDSVESLVVGLNQIFERELSIHFDLVANNNQLVFTDTATDGFNDFNNVGLLLAENPAVIDGAIGNANYDIGHVLGHTLGGSQGNATLNSVSVDALKARGASVTSNPSTQSWVQLVAHEIGHQFGAQHTFNANAFGSCAGNRSSGAAYEPASGSTLMSYAGTCGADDLQSKEDPFFHSSSFEQVVTHISGAGAPNSTSPNGGNSIPAVSAGIDYTIPAGTPFELTAIGSDADDADQLTYSWEQLDLGGARSLPLTGADTMGPLFRVFDPMISPTRVFPNLDDLLAGVDTAATGEVLPTVSRELNFRATVRDGRGGVNSDDALLDVYDTGAPFFVTSPNTRVRWTGGTTQTITWNIGGTDAAPINASNVNIMLSTDGGQTFPYDLATTVNDGSHSITVPNIYTDRARIKIQGVGNIFFDLSNVDFAINPDLDVPGFWLRETSSNTRLHENGEVDAYSVLPTTDTLGDVTVTVAADSQSLVSTDGVTFETTVDLEFDSRVARTVYARAIDDELIEGGHSTVLSHSVTSSSSASYPTGMLINSLVAHVTDNEAPPVIGVDLDLDNAQDAPTNWAVYRVGTNFDEQVLANLQRDDGIGTGIDVTFQFDPLGFSTGFGNGAASRASKPFHLPSLDEIDGYNRATIPINITWSDLSPGQDYGVFVMGLDVDAGRTLGQVVTITGDSLLPSFTQSLTDGELYINDLPGSSDQSLASFEKVVAADSGGEIEVRVVPTGDGFSLAGLAIREIPDPGPPATVETIRINGGDEQRSRLDTVEVTFNQVVSVDSSAADPFQFSRVDNGSSVSDLTSIDHSSGKTVVTFTFDPSDPSVTSFGSLENGAYQLLIDASLVTRAGMSLDGNGDGSPGGNHLFGDADADAFFRKYGDASGNNAVDLLDFALFRTTFGKSSNEVGYDASLDSDGNNTIDLLDFSAFRRNYGT